jgi:hypothetical protein
LEPASSAADEKASHHAHHGSGTCSGGLAGCQQDLLDMVARIGLVKRSPSAFIATSKKQLHPGMPNGVKMPLWFRPKHLRNLVRRMNHALARTAAGFPWGA